MSYEGREGYICGNGHVFVADTGYSNISSKSVLGFDKCPHCETDIQHVGSIDDTNCDAIANFYFEKIGEEMPVNICDCCKRPEKITPPTYKVVVSEEHGHFGFDKLTPLRNRLRLK